MGSIPIRVTIIYASLSLIGKAAVLKTASNLARGVSVRVREEALINNYYTYEKKGGVEHDTVYNIYTMPVHIYTVSVHIRH